MHPNKTGMSKLLDTRQLEYTMYEYPQSRRGNTPATCVLSLTDAPLELARARSEEGHTPTHQATLHGTRHTALRAWRWHHHPPPSDTRVHAHHQACLPTRRETRRRCLQLRRVKSVFLAGAHQEFQGRLRRYTQAHTRGPRRALRRQERQRARADAAPPVPVKSDRQERACLTRVLAWSADEDEEG